jgi:hypothetical protein
VIKIFILNLLFFNFVSSNNLEGTWKILSPYDDNSDLFQITFTKTLRTNRQGYLLFDVNNYQKDQFDDFMPYEAYILLNYIGHKKIKHDYLMLIGTEKEQPHLESYIIISATDSLIILGTNLVDIPVMKLLKVK